MAALEGSHSPSKFAGRFSHSIKLLLNLLDPWSKFLHQIAVLVVNFPSLGDALTEAEYQDLRYRKELYELMKKRPTKEDKSEEYRIPEAYDQEGHVNQKKQFAVALHRQHRKGTRLQNGKNNKLIESKVWGCLFYSQWIVDLFILQETKPLLLQMLFSPSRFLS